MSKSADCGTLEEFYTYIMSHYRKKYKESYNLEDKWISLALETYKLGVYTGLGIDSSSRYICEIYGCSYKRLANFIRELALWIERDWVMPYCLFSIQSESYFSKEDIEISWDLSIEVPHPFTVRPILDNYLIIEIMTLRFSPALLLETQISRIDWESMDKYALSNQVYDRDKRIVTINYEILFHRGEKNYVYSGDYPVKDYRVWAIR